MAGGPKPGSGKTFNGSNKNDVINGTAFADSIYGNGGNDTITGNGGADTIAGGLGNDTFRYLAFSDSSPGGIDTITDFNPSQDVIDLTAIGGATLVSAYDPGMTGRQATLTFDGARTTLSIYDGGSSPAFQLYLTGNYQTLAGIRGITLPPPQVSIGDVSVNEGSGTVTFTVTRTGLAVATTASSVSFTTADGTATSGADYVPASGVLQFATGETSKTITVALNDDRLIEDTEHLLVRLTSATNASIADGEAVATIVDNDRATNDDDILVGTDSADVIDLLAGNDDFQGLGGDDWITGGSGDDTISGGDGADFIDGGTGSNLINGDAGDDRLLFVFGDLTHLSRLIGGLGVDTLDASLASAAVLFRAQKSGDEVSIGDLTTGSTQATALEIEHWIGSGFDDVFSFAPMTIGLVLDGGDGDDQLSGGIEGDLILGGDGNDHLDGNGGTNRLNGAAGDDVFAIGRGSADTVLGGDGFDTVELSGAPLGTSVNGFENGGFEVSNPTLVASVAADVERLVGSSYADDLNFTFTLQGMVLEGGGGDDLIVGGVAADTLHGDSDNDVLDGGAGSDVIFGDGGDDRIFITYATEPFTDIIFGGEGDDVVDGRDAGTALYIERDYSEYSDNPTILVREQGSYRLLAEVHDVENWIGTNGDDQIYIQHPTTAQTMSGEGGDDFLVSGFGNDTLLGGDGNDFLRGYYGDDVIDGGAGVDSIMLIFTTFEGIRFAFEENQTHAWTVTDDEGTDTIANVEYMFLGASYFDDDVTGGDGGDWIEAYEGNDLLQGGAGDDHLFGQSGADVLRGGLGADELEGGSWDTMDLYVYGSLDESNAAYGIDTIVNSPGQEDRIDLSQIDLDLSTAEIDTADWVFVGELFRPDLDAAQATLRYDAGREGTVLQLYLQGGDSLADFELLISGAPVDETMLIGVSPMDPGLV